MSKLLQLFDKLMSRLGRKYAFVDPLGNIYLYRYFLFYVEHQDATTWGDKWLPNFYLHAYVGAATDEGEYYHRHPWNALSFVVRGGYTENVLPSKGVREVRAPGFLYHPRSNPHKIRVVQPGTLSLFMHGWRLGDWEHLTRKCEVVCDTCQRLNGGVCANEDADGLKFLQEEDSIGKPSASISRWRAPALMKVDKDFDAVIARRKRLVRSTGVMSSDDPEQWAAQVKEIVIAKKVSAKRGVA